MQSLRNFHRVALVVLVATMITTPTIAGRYKVIDRDELQKRAAAFLRADQEGDWASMYSMLMPWIREGTELDAWKAEMGREHQVVCWRIDGIKGEKKLSARAAKEAQLDFEFSKMTSAARVEATVRVKLQNGTVETWRDQVDYWIRFDGVWYLQWRGFPDD